MSKQSVPLQQLQEFIPEGCLDDVLFFLNEFKVQLTIKRARISVLGDYRFAHSGLPHRISVNGNLNKYSFLITLLHELAHLLAFEHYGKRIAPHGKEWKHTFGNILAGFLQKNIFPEDIQQALQKSMLNPAASTCGDEHLLRVLHKYDAPKKGVCLVEDIPEQQLFQIKNGQVYRKGPKLRTRHKCQDIASGKWYLFNGLYEVRPVKEG